VAKSRKHFPFSSPAHRRVEKFLQRAQTIPNFKFEATGFVPYADVARHLAMPAWASCPMRICRTHCAFVAKVVEYVACGCQRLHAPPKHPGLFPKRPMVRFSEFNGADFGKKILDWFDEPPWPGKTAPPIRRAGQSRTRLGAAVPPAVDFVEGIYTRSKN